MASLFRVALIKLERSLCKMNKPKGLKKGDKVAVVSLSSGILGESFAEHQLKLGSERLTKLGLVPVFMPHAL